MNTKSDPFADALPPDDQDAEILASSDWVNAPRRSFQGRDPWIVREEDLDEERADGDWLPAAEDRAFKAMLARRVEIELAHAESHGDPGIRARVADKREAAGTRSRAESLTDQYQRPDGAGWR